MKRITFVVNIIILLVFCFGCSESTYTDESTETPDNKLSQQELQNIHEENVKEFIMSI